jgi:NADH dehydrogenase
LTGQAPGITNDPPRVLVVGSGYAGFHALKGLERRLPAGAAELTLVSPTDYLLYSPLLPEVATGVIEPRHIAIALRQKLRRTHLVIGRVTGADLVRHTATLLPGGAVGEASPVREPVEIAWDRLILAPGSVTRMFDIPGLQDHGHAVKTLQEALYFRDHLIDQLDRADSLPATADFSTERRERLTVVAVGAGYTGTELVAQLQRWVKSIAQRWVRIGGDDVRWVLVDAASAVLPNWARSSARERSTLCDHEASR